MVHVRSIANKRITQMIERQNDRCGSENKGGKKIMMPGDGVEWI